MASLLLPLIYLSFISLGLPDALLGAAWPNMYEGLGVSVASAGVLSFIISAGTVVSSLLSGRLYARLGTGKISFFSVLLTALALLGFSQSRSFFALCLCAVPYGLGAGSIDAVLNNYVAVHYKARHMSWLHAMWGVGASLGPIIMGGAIARGSWNGGYLAVSILQFCLTAVLLLCVRRWKDEPAEAGAARAGRPLRELIRIPGVAQVLICFFCYDALEITMGMWAASYCTFCRGISAERAAQWASLFYIGITAGRIVSGFVSFKLNDRDMIRLGQGLIALSVALILLPLGNAALLLGLILAGAGCAPIYPSIIHRTPSSFGEANSQGIIGLEMACAYTGSTLMPPIFGLLAEKLSFSVYPLFLALILLVMFVTAERLNRIVRAQ